MITPFVCCSCSVHLACLHNKAAAFHDGGTVQYDFRTRLAAAGLIFVFEALSLNFTNCVLLLTSAAGKT